MALPSLALAGAVCALPALAAEPAPACRPEAGWDDPAPPLRIYANTWFVGTCGISAILITSGRGHVLIDAATERGAPIIEANVRALGFRVEDIRTILVSHAHLDHAGGVAALQHDSGASVVSRGADAAALERGRGDRSDPQFLSIPSFPAVAAVRRAVDGETVRVGDLAVTAHATPGHTPGSTTWTWTSCDASQRCLHIAYVDSLTPYTDDVYRYGDEAAHPGVVAAFRAQLEKVAALPCDVLLTPHPDASDLWLRLGGTPSEALVDDTACRKLADAATTRLERYLVDEQRRPSKRQ